MRHRLIALAFLLIAPPALADEPKPPELTAEEQKLAAEAEKLDQEGVQLYQRGQAAAAVGFPTPRPDAGAAGER